MRWAFSLRSCFQHFRNQATRRQARTAGPLRATGRLAKAPVLEFNSLEDRTSFSDTSVAGLLYAAAGGVAASLLLKAAMASTAADVGFSVGDPSPVSTDTSSASQGEAPAESLQPGYATQHIWAGL